MQAVAKNFNQAMHLKSVKKRRKVLYYIEKKNLKDFAECVIQVFNLENTRAFAVFG